MDAAVFGVIVADVIGQPMDPRHAPPPGGLQLLQSLELTTGGNVCNVGIAMARLGMKVAAAGLVGDDILGRAIVERLRSEGLDTSGIFSTDKAQTSAAVVAINNQGQSTFYHSPGAMKLLDGNIFRRCFPVIRQCAWLQIGYFGLLPAITSDLPRLLTELKQIAPGVKIALDTIEPPADWKLLEPILPHLDLFAPSRSEAVTLSGKSNPKDMVTFFRAHMPQGLIGIKLSDKGCYLDDGRQEAHIDAYPVTVRDTTGAGDAWFAGLLTGLRQNLPLDQCGRLANRVAADCCTATGASGGTRDLKDTTARM